MGKGCGGRDRRRPRALPGSLSSSPLKHAGLRGFQHITSCVLLTMSNLCGFRKDGVDGDRDTAAWHAQMRCGTKSTSYTYYTLPQHACSDRNRRTGTGHHGWTTAAPTACFHCSFTTSIPNMLLPDKILSPTLNFLTANNHAPKTLSQPYALSFLQLISPALPHNHPT